MLLLQSLNLGVSLLLLLLSAVCAMLCTWMQRVQVAWSDVWVGALNTALSG